MESALRHDIEELRLTSRKELKELEVTLTLRMGAMLAVVLAMVAALKLL